MRNYFRGGRALAIWAIVFKAANLVLANPFDTSPELALNSLRWDGDLQLRIPIMTEKAIPFQTIVLEHSIEVREYGKVYSAFALRPLETFLEFYPEDAKHVWYRPGGGLVEFRNGSTVPSYLAVLARSRITGGVGTKSTGTFTYSGGCVLMSDSKGNDFVYDEGWLLKYEKGELRSIQNPKLERFEVATNGPHIISIFKRDHEIMAVTRSERQVVISVNAASNYQLSLLYNTEHQPIDVYFNGNKLHFAYEEHRLIKEVYGLQQHRAFSWVANLEFNKGNTSIQLPFHLSYDGERTYTYNLKNGVIHMTNSEGGSVEAEMHYGTLTRIIESSRKSN